MKVSEVQVTDDIKRWKMEFPMGSAGLIEFMEARAIFEERYGPSFTMVDGGVQFNQRWDYRQNASYRAILYDDPAMSSWVGVNLAVK